MTPHTNKTRQLIDLLSFSRIEVATIVILLAGMLAIALVPSLYHASGFAWYFDYLAQHPSDAYRQYQGLSTEINSSELAGNTAVFMVWALVGLGGYVLAMAVFTFFAKTKRLAQDLEDEHTDRLGVLGHTLLQLIVRCVGIAMLLILVKVFSAHIVPFLAVMASSFVGGSSWSMAMAGSSVAFLAIVVLCCHLFVISLRVILLRRRVIFTANSFTYR